MCLRFARSPGAFRPDTRMFSLRRNLEDFGLLHLHPVHCWLDMCVCHLFNDSLLAPVLRLICSWFRVYSTCCVIFGTLIIFSITSWFLHVDDPSNDSFRDSLLWNAVNNFNDLLHCAILHALPCYDLQNFHAFFNKSVPKPARVESL